LDANVSLRFLAGFESMQPGVSIVACTCGACYERSERQLPIKDIGIFECIECGHQLEMWSGRTVPLFKRLVQRKPEARRA